MQHHLFGQTHKQKLTEKWTTFFFLLVQWETSGSQKWYISPVLSVTVTKLCQDGVYHSICLYIDHLSKDIHQENQSFGNAEVVRVSKFWPSGVNVLQSMFWHHDLLLSSDRQEQHQTQCVTLRIHKVCWADGQSLLSVIPGLWKKIWFGQQDIFGKLGAGEWPCVCHHNVKRLQGKLRKWESISGCTQNLIYMVCEADGYTSFTNQGDVLLPGINCNTYYWLTRAYWGQTSTTDLV